MPAATHAPAGSAAPADILLPTALGLVLAAYPEPVARRARAALGTLLPERLIDRTAGAWKGSLLTGDGFPVEVAFTTSDDRLRLTVEPGPASLLAADRLLLAARRVRIVGGIPVARGTLAALRERQAEGVLRYGAWVGVRCSPAATVAKLYAEVTPGSAAWPGLRLPELDGRQVVPRMIACTPATGEIEVYARVDSLLPEHVADVLVGAGIGGLTGRVLAAVEVLSGHRLRGRLPGPSVGFSYTTGGRVTLHFYARALWGGDGRIRQRYAQVAELLGVSTDSYLAVSAPLARAAQWRTRHGIVGLSILAGGAPGLTIGLRPVAP
ncbi:MAG: hypothetical protein ACOYEV_09535 [Candidatus Nanopelagicales bacterium]